LEQKPGTLRPVDGVAIDAHHLFLRVHAAADVGARDGLAVAAQAGVEDLFRSELRESDDARFAAARRDVRLPRAVAALASGVLRRLLARGEAFVVGIAIEEGEDVGVTRTADIAADIVDRQRAGRREQSESEDHPNPGHASHYSGGGQGMASSKRKIWV